MLAREKSMYLCVFVCVCFTVLISFIYSSAGRMLTQVRRRGGMERVRGRKCEIKCEEEKQIQKFIVHLAIYPALM